MFHAKIMHELVQNMIYFGENSNHAQVIPHSPYCSVGTQSEVYKSVFESY